MNKEFIPYEQALELKELGFKKDNDFGLLYKGSDIPSILYQQAFRWFRDKYEIPFEISCHNDRFLGYIRGYNPMIATSNKQRTEPIWQHGDCFDTYEEAELACLKKLIEIVKNK